MFVDYPGNNRFSVGYHLSRNNYHISPAGRIRIARFIGNFSPESKHVTAYYGDTYMRQFIRTWKRKTQELTARRLERSLAQEVLYDHCVDDVISHIIKFI